MSDSIWALLGVLLGGALGGGSQILSSHLQWKREEKAERRKQRTQNLYDLQDQMLAIHHFVFERIRVRHTPFAAAVAVLDDEGNRNHLRSLMRSVENVSVRVGDDPLSSEIDGALKGLFFAMEEGSLRVREDHLVSARRGMKRAQYRIGELLHTDIEIDPGLGPMVSQDKDNPAPEVAHSE